MSSFRFTRGYFEIKLFALNCLIELSIVTHIGIFVYGLDRNEESFFETVIIDKIK